MPRNTVISLRPAAAWHRALGTACADTQATYGCVDWYLYQNAPVTPCESAVSSGPAFAAPCSSIIERAAAAAGAAATAVTHAPSAPEIGARQNVC